MAKKGREDLNRQHRLESIGVHFIRFDDRMVKREMHNVLCSIEGWIREHAKKGQSHRLLRADAPEKH